jgi:hypothetical protein
MCPTCAKLWWRLWTYMVLTSPEGLLILYRSGLFAIDTSIVNCQKCPRHRDDLEVYWKRQKRTYRSPWFILLRFMRNFQDTYRHQHYSFWLKSRPFLPVGAGKNLINCLSIYILKMGKIYIATCRKLITSKWSLDLLIIPFLRVTTTTQKCKCTQDLKYKIYMIYII